MLCLKVILVAFLFINFRAFCQESRSAFIEKRNTIDSAAVSIEGEKNLLIKRMVGSDSLFAGYIGMYYYLDDIKKPQKIECIFESGEEGQKTFYYADSLVKIVDKGTPFYYIDKLLVKDNGSPADMIKAGRLLYFEAGLRKLILLLFEAD